MAFLLLSAALTIIPKGTCRAETIQAASLDQRPLKSEPDKSSFDGAISQNIVFRTRTRVFQYTPPPGWSVKFDGSRATFKRGHVAASFVLSATEFDLPTTPQTPGEDQLRNFGQETLAKATALGPATVFPLQSLPLRVAGEVATESTAAYELSGKPHMLQRVRTWGQAWQLQLEINGPAAEIQIMGPVLIRSLCSLDVRQDNKQQIEVEAAAVREKEYLSTRLATEQKTQAAVPGGQTRGRTSASGN